MGDVYDIGEVLVSFTTAWVCTIARCTEYLPESEFIKIPFAGGSVYSMCRPPNHKENDKINERHRGLYSWLLGKACEELKGDEEQCIVLWIVDRDEEDAMDDQAVHGAHVIQCSKSDRFEQNDKMIRERTISILKAVQVCCLTDEDLPEAFAVDVEVAKGTDGLRAVEELAAKEQRVEHGSLHVGYWGIRCWMLFCKGS